MREQINPKCSRFLLSAILIFIISPLLRAQDSTLIELPEKIIISGIPLSDSLRDSTRKGSANESSSKNYDLSIYDIAEFDSPNSLVNISSLTDEELQTWEPFRAIYKTNNPLIVSNLFSTNSKIRLIGYFPPTGKLLINQNGFMYAIYTGIHLYDMAAFKNNPFPIWKEGGPEKKSYIVPGQFPDFHIIKSTHTYDISDPNEPRMVVNSNYLKYQFHQQNWENDQTRHFEGCENLATHPKLEGILVDHFGDEIPAWVQNDMPDNLKITGRQARFSHYIIGFRLFDVSSDGVLSFHKGRENLLANVPGQGSPIGVFPASDQNIFYIVDNTGIYIFNADSGTNALVGTRGIVSANISNIGNFPNPFNPLTTITFELSHEAHVTVNIFDSRGRTVSTLISEHLAAGIYREKWDATAFASGMYFYQILTRVNASAIVDNRSEMHKLLLVK